MSRTVIQKLREFHMEEIRPYMAARNRKPLLTQAREMLALCWRYHYPPVQYLRACLYLKSAPEDIRSFMPSRLLWDLRESLNPPGARVVARDKLLFRQRMEAAGLPVLREVLVVDEAGAIRNSRGDTIDTAAALDLLSDGEFFAKPIDGRFGAGARLLLPGHDIETFLTKARNTMVQPRLRQHSLLSALYPHAVSTVRIDTLRVGSDWVSNAAVLRVGMGGSIVDNGSSGGLTVGVNIDTGALQAFGRRKPKFSTEAFDRHPDTGVLFNGLVLPHWELLRETVARAAEEMLPLQTIGWDVVIVPDGVVLLEANDSWGIYVLQSGWGGMADTPIGRMACKRHGLTAAGP